MGVTVSLSITFTLVTIVAGTDYTQTTDTLTFTSTSGATLCVTVPITDDPDVEGDQTFTVNYVLDFNATNVLGGAGVSPDSTTVTIQDDDSQLLCHL